MKKIILCIALLSFFVPALLFSQNQEAYALLEYFEDEYEIQIYDADGFQVDEIYYGMELNLGDTVKTNGSYAELRLDPNGTIIKLAPDTDFTLEALQGKKSDANAFALLKGKMRTIAAQGEGYNYSIRTPSAVCGVRGTDFGLEVLRGSRDAAAVLKGSIEFINLNTGKSLTLTKGMAADVFADVFEPFTLPMEQMEQLFSEMNFVQLDPSTVPGYTPGPAADAEKGDSEEKAAEEETEGGQEEPAVTEPDTQEEEEETAEKKKDDKPKKNLLQPVLDFLKDKLEMEIGTITVDGQTYSKAVIQPVISIGKFGMGLYLPIIYQQDLFDADTWYKPQGNDEWSFGTDHSGEGAGPILLDILIDLVLKIKYIEWGEQRDPFFFKVGNINDLTIGHGILMYNYANDYDYPAVRRIGVNLGLDAEKLGLETVVNDLTDPEIFGARFYVRPVGDKFPFAFGISSIVDIDPASSIPIDPDIETEPIQYGDPVFINAALDIDFPIIEKDMFSLILFGDFGGMLPYFRESYPASNITGGLALNALYSDDEGSFKLKNYGIMAGLFGNIAKADYRLEYRYYNGTFKPNFFNPTYDRIRGGYVTDLAGYFADPSAEEYQEQLMGIYGEVGFTIKEAFTFEGGYMWPWSVGPSGITTSDEDYFLLKMALATDVIPVVGIGASISYERTRFIPALLQKDATLSFFDANTVVKGELIYPAAEILDMALIVTTSLAYDTAGNLIMSDKNPSLPLVRPSISFETRIHF